MATSPVQGKPPNPTPRAAAHPPPPKPALPFRTAFERTNTKVAIGAGVRRFDAVSPRGSSCEPAAQPNVREHHGKHHDDAAEHEDPLDPMTRYAAQSAPPMVTPPIAAPAALAATPFDPSSPIAMARASLEDLLPMLVRKVAWAGDGKRGTVRMELSAGALAGATLVVHADHGHVRVELDAPANVNAAEWRARIHERLTQRGLLVDAIDVR